MRTGLFLVRWPFFWLSAIWCLRGRLSVRMGYLDYLTLNLSGFLPVHEPRLRPLHICGIQYRTAILGKMF